jgi:hypothetical protein
MSDVDTQTQLGMDDTQLDYVFSSVRRVIELESILSGVNE